MRRCQQHKAPQYLTDCVTPASDIPSRQRLRSASRHQLLVPRYRLSSLGRRSFAVAGPTTWNSLSADLRDPPTCSDESFRRSLKTFLFAKYWCVQRIRGFSMMMRYINRHYLSIYLSIIYLSNKGSKCIIDNTFIGVLRLWQTPQTYDSGSLQVGYDLVGYYASHCISYCTSIYNAMMLNRKRHQKLLIKAFLSQTSSFFWIAFHRILNTRLFSNFSFIFLLIILLGFALRIKLFYLPILLSTS